MSSKVTLSSWLQKKKKRETKAKLKVFGNHEEFLSRINKTLCYGKLPKTDRFSLPVTELAAEIFSKARFPGNGVHLSLRPEGKMLGLERLSVGEAGEISRAACISPCSLVLALIYVDRLRECNPKYLEKTSPSKLFVVSMMVASKFLHDDGEDDEVFNDEWAASSGIKENELNCAEREFLCAIDWRVNVREQQFWEWLEAMEEAVAFREGLRKGWFTYSDLNYLLQSKELFTIANTLLTVSAVCLTSYTAGLLTLLGSTIFVSSLPSPATLILHTLHHSSLLAAKPAQVPLELPTQRYLDNISESYLEGSLIETSADCTITMVDKLEKNVCSVVNGPIFTKDKESRSYFPFINFVSLPKIYLPDMKSLGSLFNCVNVASKLFDSLFPIGGNCCNGHHGMKPMERDSLYDVRFHIRLFNRNWVVGENVSRSFQIFNHYLNSGTSSGFDDKIVCSLDSKNDQPYLHTAVSIPPHTSVPLEASQY